jgi:hypothetical protein
MKTIDRELSRLFALPNAKEFVSRFFSDVGLRSFPSEFLLGQLVIQFTCTQTIGGESPIL